MKLGRRYVCVCEWEDTRRDPCRQPARKTTGRRDGRHEKKKRPSVTMVKSIQNDVCHLGCGARQKDRLVLSLERSGEGGGRGEGSVRGSEVSGKSVTYPPTGYETGFTGNTAWSPRKPSAIVLQLPRRPTKRETYRTVQSKPSLGMATSLRL